MTDNELAIKTFCEQFTPALRYGKTDRINGQRFGDAWQASYWDSKTGVGIIAVSFDGGLHAYIEAAGTSEIAQGAGQVMARAMQLFDQSDVIAGNPAILPPTQ